MSTCVSQQTLTLATARIGERFAPLRIVEPQSERAMLHSMEKYGQLTPVAVCRIGTDEHELLDGFKRLRAARQLGLAELTARPFDLSIRAGKAAMLQLNRVGRAISGMEEALVVHSLCHEDGLNQVEIARLLSRHKSWVCRRLALIEHLCDEAQDMIRLGLLPASLGTELARLQRRNQELLLAAIGEHHLSVRETRRVVNALESEPSWNHEAIMRDPRRLLSPEQARPDPAQEQGMSVQGKKVLRTLVALERSCLEAALLVSGTDPGMYEPHEEARLRAACVRALPSLARVEKELRAMTAHDVTVEP